VYGFAEMRTQAKLRLAGSRGRTPPVKDVGEPCAGEPHARFYGGELEKESPMAAEAGGPRETEGPAPGIAYG